MTYLACRLFTTAVSVVTSPQDAEHDQWQKSFIMSYDVGAALVKGTDFLPGGIDHITSGSHLLRLCMQHQQLVAPPAPVAGQGKSCSLLTGSPRVMRRHAPPSWNSGHFACASVVQRRLQLSRACIAVKPHQALACRMSQLANCSGTWCRQVNAADCRAPFARRYCLFTSERITCTPPTWSQVSIITYM